MVNGFQIKLSSKEILLLAALMGYESVFCIEEKFFLDANYDLRSMVRQYVRRLERKKLIRYDLDGVLYIIPSLRQAIDCICNAETVGIFSTNVKSSKKSSIYVTEKKDTVTTIEHIGNRKYVICITDNVYLKRIIPCEILSSQYCELREKMLFEEAEYVHSLIQAFNHDDAEAYIEKHIKNSASINVISNILSGNCKYMSVQIYRKRKKIYNAIYNSLLVVIDNCTISLVADENGVLCFEAVSPVNVVEQISSQFKLSEKRGAV